VTLSGSNIDRSRNYSGPCGWSEMWVIARVETQDIVQLEDAAPLAVSAMFRALQRDRLVGDAPKLVAVDEAWSLLRHPLFADELQSWAREMRKLKAALVIATQSLADLSAGDARVVFDQVANRIYLPHAEAMRPQTRALYEAAGLTAEQVQLLSVAQPKGEYLLQTEELTRLVQVRLEGEALAVCGASTPADHARARALLARGVAPGEAFVREWLSMATKEWLAAHGGVAVVAKVALFRAILGTVPVTAPRAAEGWIAWSVWHGGFP